MHLTESADKTVVIKNAVGHKLKLDAAVQSIRHSGGSTHACCSTDNMIPQREEQVIVVEYCSLVILQ